MNILEVLSASFFVVSIMFFLCSLLIKDLESKRLLQGVNIGFTICALVLLLIMSLPVIDKV